MIKKYRIRRSTRTFFDLHGIGVYKRTVVFLDTFYCNVKSESEALFTYKKIENHRIPIIFHPPQASDTIEALDLYFKGITTGYRQNFSHIYDFEIINEQLYRKLKSK